MKQTPIPEKIEPYCEVEGYQFNSLIDVLTEQQKEIDGLQRENVKYAPVVNLDTPDNNCKKCGHDHFYAYELTRCVCCSSNCTPSTQPYTAMRSTGEFCVCPSPMQCNCLLNGNKCGECHSCHKLLKPQEDEFYGESEAEYQFKREKLAEYLYRQFNRTQMKWEGLYEVSKTNWYIKASRILAIVKGE